MRNVAFTRWDPLRDLLAELGLVGLFLAGATFLVGDFGPVGPFKGRASEWGQMLGAIQFYAITAELPPVALVTHGARAPSRT